MRLNGLNDIMIIFSGHETTVASVARYMLRHNLTPADVLSAHDEWMAARMAEMKKTVRSVKSGVRSEELNNSTLHPPRSTLKKRHKAGDYAVMPRACPRCNGTLELLQLCHISSPVWRTQLACENDGCAWFGKSKLPIDALLAAGAKNIKDNVTEG